MFLRYLIPILTSSAITLSLSPAWGQSTTSLNITFTCEDNQGIPITVAKNSEGKTQIIFHWKPEALQYALQTPQELCHSVSTKLNEYNAQGYDINSLILTGKQVSFLLAICVNFNELFGCNKVLITFDPASIPSKVAHKTLRAILDPKVLDNKIQLYDRLPDDIYYPVNLFQNKK